MVTREKIEKLIRENEIELKPTQPKLCVPIIGRIHRKMLKDIRLPGIKVKGDLICQGHHRYIASLLSDRTVERIPGETSSNPNIIDWKSVIFEAEDWDTKEDIEMHNRLNAELNNMSIEDFNRLLE